MRISDGFMLFGRDLKPTEPLSREPDWVQAKIPWIENALERALELPSGGWYVVGASRDIENTPKRHRIDEEDYVVWRSKGTVIVAPDACPHLGASLADGAVKEGCVVCPWHGLTLGADAHGRWHPVESYDDGVLAWIRIPGEPGELTARPIVSPRPDAFLDSVMRMEAACEPRDVIANRLDPWHGVYYHPHTFKRLRVIGLLDDRLVVRVVYGFSDRLGIEVGVGRFQPDRSRIHQHFGAFQRVDAGQFRVPLVPAGREPEPRPADLDHREPGVAGCEVPILVVVGELGDVDLATVQRHQGKGLRTLAEQEAAVRGYLTFGLRFFPIEVEVTALQVLLKRGELSAGGADGGDVYHQADRLARLRLLRPLNKRLQNQSMQRQPGLQPSALRRLATTRARW